MKVLVIVLGAISLALLLAAGAFAAGHIMGQSQWRYGMMGPEWFGRSQRGGLEIGRGDMMPGYRWFGVPRSGINSLEEAVSVFEEYLDRTGYDDLHLTEVMEFERNYYAIAAEEDTGIGAMELLLDKTTGTVMPEPGPNMMWNTKYGMHRGGMMGRSWRSGEMVLSPEEAQDLAQRWLDANFPGSEAGTADPFYGYYTLHFSRDGRIEGMLSVHGDTGEVWYHSWHGGFVQMTEHEDHA